jgi:hypothetical protein
VGEWASDGGHRFISRGATEAMETPRASLIHRFGYAVKT